MKFKIVSYSMGRPMTEKTVEGTEGAAYAAAEKMAAYGLPGTGKGAASKSRVCGIVRLGADGRVIR